MPPVDIVGKVGRALTEVGSTGRVEVGGAVYDALTTRTPIPAGELVEVTGWRLIGESSHVLHVRRPGDDSPVGPDARDGRSADAKLFVKRDWERIAAECFVAVIASAGLLALAHLYRP